MDSREFISVIKKIVRDAAVSDTISVMEHPPGRKPPQESKDRAEWYRSLDHDQRRLLASVIADAADRVIFGLLCVVDGVRAVEDGEVKGRFELRYVKGTATLLNDPNDVMLHDLYKSR